MKSDLTAGRLATVRRCAVWVRDRLDGVAHPWRRRRAARRLARISPDSVLFLCYGNVCRSPFAEAVLARADSSVRVTSSGFIGPGRAPPEEAIEAASERGFDTSEHISGTVTSEMLSDAGVIFVFDRFQVRELRATPGAKLDGVVWLGDLDPIWTGKRAIIDPWGRGEEFFARTFERIERCVNELVSILAEAGSSPTGRTRG